MTMTQPATNPTITIQLDPASGTNHALVKPRDFLGREAFGSFRACIDGARYDGSRRVNVATLDRVPAILRRLSAAGFALDVEEALADRLRDGDRARKVEVASAEGRLEQAEAILKARGLSLFAFQRSGVRWLAGKSACLLADQMGLGKTVQALVAMPEGAPVLVVCPAVAKGVWAREAAAWRPDLAVAVLKGRKSFRWPAPGEMVVVNYDILPASFEDAPEGLVLVFDEAHALKNHKALRTIKCRALSAKAARTWLLTATPLLGKPPELWGVLGTCGLEREALGTWGNFVRLFAGKKDHWGGMTWGTPAPEVPRLLERVMLRRMREDVLADLPSKRWEELEVEVDASALRACDALVKRLGGDVDSVLERVRRSELQFSEFSTVREALATAKIPAMLEIVASHEDEGEPLVVFSAHRAPIDLLGQRDGWAAITGDTSAEERTRIQERFQAGQLRGVAATVQAGGVAITLTRSARVLFVDRDWTPALNAQAEDRICRIGQKRGCLVTTLVAPHALDRRLAAILTSKTAIVDAAMPVAVDGEAPADETGDVQALLDSVARLKLEVDAEAAAGKTAKAKKPRRGAATARERWAARALCILSGLDPDGASVQNDVGFNKLDGGIGHSLAEQLAKGEGLTDKQWQLAARICAKYHRQVGAMSALGSEDAS